LTAGDGRSPGKNHPAGVHCPIQLAFLVHAHENVSRVQQLGCSAFAPAWVLGTRNLALVFLAAIPLSRLWGAAFRIRVSEKLIA
jgi:hypothetical protein